MSTKHLTTTLMSGDFVRVNARHEDGTRAGKDGLVLAVSGEEAVVVFAWDRCGQDQNVISVGPEHWEIADLDLTSVDRETAYSEGREQRYRVNNILAYH